MITFKIKPKRDLFLSFLDLNDMIADGKKQYKETMLGPYEDLMLEEFGIVLDGDNEKMLADDFEKVLSRRGRKYTRTNQYGIIFYEAREY